MNLFDQIIKNTVTHLKEGTYDTGSSTNSVLPDPVVAFQTLSDSERGQLLAAFTSLHANPNQKITYTITWTQDPSNWDLKAMVNLLKQAKNQAEEVKTQLIEKQLENKDFALANQVIAKFRVS